MGPLNPWLAGERLFGSFAPRIVLATVLTLFTQIHAFGLPIRVFLALVMKTKK